MANLNKVFLIGNLTRDPELRYIPSGSAVATFTVAVNRVFVSQSGEKKEQTSFIRVVVWGRRAEVCGEYLAKGRPVFVEGRLQSREWQAQDGQKRSTIEVVADNVQFLRGGQTQSAAAAKGASQAPPLEEIETINLNQDTQVPEPPQADKNDASKNGPSPSEEAPF